MNKPNFAAEPSMEDILASIRKMISEERNGPRPLPDQIGRTPFGESLPEAEATKAAPGFQPGPDPETAPAPEQRPGSNFSSLSDALKAATPAAPQRRTLEEKIADMLEDGEGPGGEAAKPADPLAVFAANRSSPTAPGARQPGAEASTGAPASGRQGAAARPEPERGPERPAMRTSLGPETAAPPPKPVSPTNGVAPPREPRVADQSAMGAFPGDRPVARRETPPARPMPEPVPPKTAAPAPSPDPKKPETQRIIAMPPRPSAATGASQVGGTPPGPAVNGSGAPALGPRPNAGGPQAARPDAASHDAEKVLGKVADKVSEKLSAKGAGAEPAKRDEPRTQPRAAPVRQPPAPAREKLGTADAAAPTAAGMFSTTVKPSEKQTSAAQAAPREQSTNTPAAARAPSEALIDAVVDLVHKEPDSLSVFTSGSAFIHGVTSHELVPSKPGPNATRKLDRSAAELLRPMLRQWLAENMPRIVEEALRSELMSGQSSENDTDEA